MRFKKIKYKFVEKIQLVFLIELGIRIEKTDKVPLGTKSSLFMNHTTCVTPQEYIFQIWSQSVEPFNLKVGEHRDIESPNYSIDINIEKLAILLYIYY